MARSTPEQARNKLGLVAAKKMEAAAEALHAYRMACLECDDHAAQHDRRKSLVGELQEMAAWLEGCCK
ncbi:hypothetical protein [Pseudomonas aeruginosa]|uniref:hypothetical protein n=1 Tax=Pseudomonas aeruginosa TaxID=287 RepID=UPI0023585F38|nr:hypothetical protein KKY75_17470 [Pseudomonas aeruginosa]